MIQQTLNLGGSEAAGKIIPAGPVAVTAIMGLFEAKGIIWCVAMIIMAVILALTAYEFLILKKHREKNSEDIALVSVAVAATLLAVLTAQVV